MADDAGAKRIRLREQVTDFHCVAGWSHRRLRWEGVAMRDLCSSAHP